MIKPAARRAWIAQYLLNREAATLMRHYCDVLDSAFVVDYIEATGAPYAPTIIGADSCATLGRDLGAMYRDGVLCRQSTGINSPTAGGWPKWVWSYYLANAKAEALQHGVTFDQIVEHIRTNNNFLTFPSSVA